MKGLYYINYINDRSVKFSYYANGKKRKGIISIMKLKEYNARKFTRFAAADAEKFYVSVAWDNGQVRYMPRKELCRSINKTARYDKQASALITAIYRMYYDYKESDSSDLNTVFTNESITEWDHRPGQKKPEYCPCPKCQAIYLASIPSYEEYTRRNLS